MLITSLADTFLQFDSSQIIANFPFRMRHTGPVVPKCLNTQGTKSNTPLGTPRFSSDVSSTFPASFFTVLPKVLTAGSKVHVGPKRATILLSG